MEFTIETVSPADAQKYLETSPYNRVTNSSRRVAATYAAAMKRGEWRLNGECIVFDNAGRLIDGHHRLIGVTIAGVPVQFAICRGVDREAFTTYNCGLRTNLSQVLGMHGVKNSSLIMGIVNVNYSLENTGRIRMNNGQQQDGKVRTVTSDYHTYLADKDGYDSAASTACRLYAYGSILKSSWIGGLYYFLTHKGGYSVEEVLPFFDALCNLDASGISPCDSLRTFIIHHRMMNMKTEDTYLAALVIKAWNAFITGKEVKKIAYYPDREEYPKFILKH